jgi:hypothetical protein
VNGTVSFKLPHRPSREFPSCAWRLTRHSFFDGRPRTARQTSGTVTLLLPPRQSRGISLGYEQAWATRAIVAAGGSYLLRLRASRCIVSRAPEPGRPHVFPRSARRFLEQQQPRQPLLSQPQQEPTRQPQQQYRLPSCQHACSPEPAGSRSRRACTGRMCMGSDPQGLTPRRPMSVQGRA